jgi:hypothetical protein
MLAKRKCWCEHCKAEFNFKDGVWDDDNCPVCGNDDPDYVLIPIPDYETPSQYRKRTGKRVTKKTAVWVATNYGCSGKRKWEWYIDTYAEIKSSSFYKNNPQPIFIVIADPPVPPPYGWKPE